MNKEYLLLGHQMFIGGETFYFRDTGRGIGGSREVSHATLFTEEGARYNQTPAYDELTGRGWEMIHRSRAKDLIDQGSSSRNPGSFKGLPFHKS